MAQSAQADRSKRQKTEGSQTQQSDCDYDYVLGIPFSEKRRGEFVRLGAGADVDANVNAHATEVVCWAPALVWLWKTENRVMHPHSGAPVSASELRAVAIAASAATLENATGPASFLATLDENKQGKPIREEEIFTMCSELETLENRTVAPMRQLKDALLQGMACAHAYMVDACLLQNVGDPIAAIHSLSKTWVWMYDAIVGKLISLCPTQALDVIIGPSGHMQDYERIKSTDDMYSYNPIVLLPLLRHVVFLEEFVSRSALGTLNNDIPWRYTHVMQRIQDVRYNNLSGGDFSRAAFIRCSEYESRPLGANSELCYPASIVHRDYEVLMDEIGAAPLVAPGGYVPSYPAPLATNRGISAQSADAEDQVPGETSEGGIFRFFQSLFAIDQASAPLPPVLQSVSSVLSLGHPGVPPPGLEPGTYTVGPGLTSIVSVSGNNIPDSYVVPDWGIFTDSVMADAALIAAAHDDVNMEIHTQSAGSDTDTESESDASLG
jgi:hypothetical protein